MKKLMLLSAVLLSALSVSAQRTQVSASYGASSAMYHMGAYSHNWHDVNGWGAVNFTVDHKFIPNLWLGLSYTYSSGSSNNAVGNHYGEVTWHALMVNARYEWYSRGPLKLYSHAGVGALVQYYTPSWSPSYNRSSFAFQVSPVGAEVSLLGRLGVFAEVGYGVQGVAKIGIRLGF
ncbi:MAG: hypothetical protein K2M94_03730 [Paramuribaculum sp.]|nr:hypothetical protein [Paramuribaculum sp.]